MERPGLRDDAPAAGAFGGVSIWSRKDGSSSVVVWEGRQKRVLRVAFRGSDPTRFALCM